VTAAINATRTRPAELTRDSLGETDIGGLLHLDVGRVDVLDVWRGYHAGLSRGQSHEDTPVADLEQDQRIRTVCLLILTGLGIGFALYVLRPVLIPFVLAIFLTYCLVPLVDFQIKRLRVPRPLALLSTAVLAALILVGLGMIVSTSVSQMSASSETYRDSLLGLIDELAEDLPLEWLGLEWDSDEAAHFNLSDRSIGRMVSSTIGAIVGVLSQGMLVLIFVIFLLAGRTSSGASSEGLVAEVEASVRRYLLAMVSVSGLTGILVGVTLKVLGVDFALVFGLMAFLLNFIPNIGSIIATIVPLPVVLLNPELSPTAKVLAFAIPGLIQFVIGNLLAPKVMGQSLDLHPVVVLLALIFFGMLWGIIGMFLATPITAVIKILLEKLQLTAPLAGVLAGRLSGVPPPS
jgi:AI-2 transport protein TqsA